MLLIRSGMMVLAQVGDSCPAISSCLFYHAFSFEKVILQQDADAGEGQRKMFKKLFKKSQDEVIYAPMNGEITALEHVPDPVFSEKMMGEGIAIIPEDGKVVSPVNGEVIHLPDSKHAIGLRTEAGIEILIHIGLETVALNGEGFTPQITQGDIVQVGDVLIEFNLDYIRHHADDIITPIIWTNGQSSDKTLQQTKEKTAKAGESMLLTIG